MENYLLNLLLMKNIFFKLMKIKIILMKIFFKENGDLNTFLLLDEVKKSNKKFKIFQMKRLILNF